MLKWLTKAGRIIATGLQYAGVIPLLPLNQRAQAIAAKITDTMTLIAQQIVTVEAIFVTMNDPTKKGSDKLVAATPQVAQVILSADFMIGKRVKDQILFQGGCMQVTSGMADILNSLEDIPSQS